ncbi:fungal-specific transcription factor domain-containing protein [Mucor mucedo]|uniref:fungal-specific transcription factor domain-containing protein n=1 Tax=Mucor mucedo TaxID=29922 RepID=UPI0022200F28|nr:fungal-specific transcription factor domain-containing protein [Mucor mucedo]KAI7894234.1 fungal-specific transcription factor domain-containing protein [Mucor mucedo]
MESLLTTLTKSSMKEIERNDFRAESYLSRNKIDYQQEDMDDDVSSIEDDDDSIYSNQHSHNDVDDDVDTISNNMEETLANLNLEDYDSIKYTGHSAGLQLLDENLFKSKSYVQLPGREDVALRLMSQNELLVVRSDRSSSGKNTRMDVGFSLSSTIFDEKKTTNSWNLGPISKDLPINSVIEKAIKLYFSHIHTFLPIVNRTRFEAHDMKSPNVLVQAVLAVAFKFASRHFPKLFSKKAALFADVYFKKVMLRLQDSTCARLRHVQAALLMTLYLDMEEMDVESMQWYTLGKAIRMAQDIGLHRSCSNWNLPPSEIETRHRVFYACYILDRLMGARAGKPLTILDRDFDTDLPVPYEVYDDISIKQGPSIYHSFISLIKLSEILGRVLKALYAPKSKHSNSNAGLDDPTILAVFDRRLKNWKASLDQSEDGTQISQAQKVNLLLLYYTVMLLLHRPFIEFSALSDTTSNANVIHGSVDLDTLAKDSRQACENAASNISVIVRQKQSLMADPDSYAPFCLPTCFVYSMFQSSLIHLAIVIKNRDSLRRLRLLQRSIGLLKQHEELSSGKRAHNILIMLVTINGINLDNLLENDTTKEEDMASIFEDGLARSPPSPIPAKNHNELQFSTRLSNTQQMQAPQQIQTMNRNAMIPGCEDNMPKSSWYQRMMNTSIIGGITPDLHEEANSSSQTLEQLLPYAPDINPPHHQHTRTNSNTNVYQHTRSDSNNTLYNQQQNDIPNYHNNPAYYDLAAPSLQQPNHVRKHTKRIESYDRPNIFGDAGEDMHVIQAENGNPTYQNGPTLLSHSHTTHFQRNGVTPLHQTPLPFTASYGNMNPTLNNGHNDTSAANSYPISYLPPSSLNWSDWGVYLGQQNPSIPTTSPENNHH